MKITITFPGDEKGPKTSLKLELPTKWLDGPMAKVLDTFVSNYNKKNAATPLEDAHFVTKTGETIRSDEIVGKCAVGGSELLIMRGKPPAGAPVAAPVSTVKHVDVKNDDEEDVTTKAGLEKAKEKAKFSFDHSKWDKLDLSDDDALDCHPNIETASWKRIKAQQRAERRAKEEAELKRMQEKLEKYQNKARELKGKDEKGYAEATINVTKYKQKIDEFQERRKWVADDVCVPKEDRSLINPKAVEYPPPKDDKSSVIGPVATDGGMDLESYDAYIKQHETLLREFVSIESNRTATEKFMIDHPVILSQHADGFLLLLCLDVAMKHASIPDDKKTPKQIDMEARELKRVVRQHLMLNYVLELAKLSKVDDVRAAVRPFFLKTGKQTKEQADDFEKELVAFVGRIKARAQEKLAKGEKSPLDRKVVVEEEEPEYEPAGLGPGGLDPNEVLPTLPKEMQEAFVEQDVAKLKRLMESLPPDEADYHLQRCIASGLWVVPRHVAEEEEEGEESSEPSATHS